MGSVETVVAVAELVVGVVLGALVVGVVLGDGRVVASVVLVVRRLVVVGLEGEGEGRVDDGLVGEVVMIEEVGMMVVSVGAAMAAA